MEVQARNRRWLAFAMLCVLCGFGGVIARLYHLQVVRHDELSAKAKKYWERTIVKASRRGDIRDARGMLLATSKPVKTVCADPSVLGTNYVEVAVAIAPLLEMSAVELAEKLRPTMFTNSQGKLVEDKYVVLKRKVEVERWQEITNAMAHLKFVPDETVIAKKTREQWARIRSRALMTEADEERVYPNGALASHLLGFAGMSMHETANGPALMTSGKDGLELALDSVLNGVHGWVQTETDSKRREVVSRRDQNVAPREGLDAYLTIDAGVQHIVETELLTAWEKHTPISVSAAVIRPKTGEILAMANLPNFDPNRPGDFEPEHRRNRFITDQAEPGSTFKIVAISAALNEGIVGLDDVYHCENGLWHFAGRSLKDDHSYGPLTVERVISKSSNIGTAKIAIKLGPQRLYQYMMDFGFGARSGILLPGEALGKVWETEKWRPISISRIPIGQGVATTPLQMLMAMSAIANEGVLMRPMLLAKLVDRNGNTVMKAEPQPVRQVISPRSAREMVKALKTTVSTNGTAAKAAMQYYTVAGKTGTAQKPINGIYPRGKYFSSFIGFFPADNPELCISVIFDEPKRGYYGSETGVPVFKRIAERSAKYLAIPVEKPPKEAFAMTGFPSPR